MPTPELSPRLCTLIDAAKLHVETLESSKALLALFDQQAKENEALLARIAELEAQVGLPISEQATQHTGLHAGRFKNNPLEAKIAEWWASKQERGQLLGMLLGTEGRQGFVTQRDATVAATLIQWLATDVGQNFLCDVHRLTQGQFLKELIID